MAKKKKSYKVSVAVLPPTPLRVLSKRPLAPSVTSVTSVANDKGDNEMILGLCTYLLVFGRGKSRKLSARRASDEGTVRPVIALNGVPFI